MKPAIVMVDGERHSFERLEDDVQRWYGGEYAVRAFQRGRDADAFVQEMSAAGTPVPLVIAGQELLGPKWALCHQIERVSPFTVRAVVASDKPDPGLIEAMKQHGVDRILPQSYNEQRMRIALDALLSRHHSMRRLKEETEGRLGGHIFMTGGAGFLGSRLVRELLRCSEAKITLILRGKNNKAFDERLEFSPADYPGRLEVLEGDITEADLGLKPDEVAALQETVDEVWHLAAITSFDSSLRDAIMRVNVDSTARMLDFASRIRHLSCFNHVSTAYVSGKRAYPEVVHETLEENPPGFKNPYEESKWLAERLVAGSGLPCLIYRPSVVFGESYSGRSDGKTVYGVAHAFRMAKRLYERKMLSKGAECVMGAFRVCADNDANLNVVPVNCVVDMLLRIRAKKQPDGSIFHLTHPNPITMGQLYEVVAALNGVEKGVMQPSLQRGDLLSAEAFLMRKLETFIPYMVASDPVFDLTNTRAVLRDYHVPDFDRGLLRFSIGAFYQYVLGDTSMEHWETEQPEDAPWGRRGQQHIERTPTESVQ